MRDVTAVKNIYKKLRETKTELRHFVNTEEPAQMNILQGQHVPVGVEEEKGFAVM